MEHDAWNLIWELSWLKEHDVLSINSFIVSINSLIKRGEIILIKGSWDNSSDQVKWIIPGWHWLIKWVESDDILVGAETLSHLPPVSNIFVLQLEVVLVKSSEKGERLWRGVIDEETVLLAVLNQWETITIVSEVIVGHWNTEASHSH